MKLTKLQFDRIILLSRRSDLHTTKEIAEFVGISERMVQRAKEAGTWARWPYIVAKTTHGYNTPEYKTYLKRRGLPLTPPAKTSITHMSVSNAPKEKVTTVTQKHSGFWRKMAGWFK